MRLMLKLLSFERVDPAAGGDLKWFFPSNVLPANITASLGALNQFLLSPPTVADDPKSLLRPVRKRARRAPSASGSSSELENRPKKVRRKKAAETQAFKSAAFIVDSDDDEEADVAFFARERELRAEMEALAAQHGSVMLDIGAKKRKSQGKGKNKGKSEATERTDGSRIGGEDNDMEESGMVSEIQADGSELSANGSEGK